MRGSDTDTMNSTTTTTTNADAAAAADDATDHIESLIAKETDENKLQELRALLRHVPEMNGDTLHEYIRLHNIKVLSLFRSRDQFDCSVRLILIEYHDCVAKSPETGNALTAPETVNLMFKTNFIGGQSNDPNSTVGYVS